MDILLALKASDKRIEEVDKQRLEKKVNDVGNFDDDMKRNTNDDDE